MQLDAIEVLKRAWYHIRRNREIWPLALFIAVSGGGAQGFSLWVQSPIPRGLAGYSPLHQVGERITDYAKGNLFFWVTFITFGLVMGLAFLAVGVFAQVCTVGAVAEMESGGRPSLKESLRWGRRYFWRYVVLVLGYMVVLLFFSAPIYIIYWSFGSSRNPLPCLGVLVFSAVMLVVSAVAAVVLELSARFVVLEDNGVVESVLSSWYLLRESYREVALTWLMVLIITLLGTFVMAVALVVLTAPVSWLSNAAFRNESAILITLSIVAFLAAWVGAAAVTGAFTMMCSAIWTVAFIELEPSAAPGVD